MVFRQTAVKAIGYTIDPIDKGEWYQVIFVGKPFSADSVEFFTYVNGELQERNHYWNVPIDGRMSLDASVMLFGDNDEEDDFITVDQVALYDKALSATEVMNVYNGTTGISQKSIGSSFNLQNAPNPFTDNTKINFYLDNASQVKISVYTISGQEVAVISDEFFTSGSHSIDWNASNIKSGVYLYKIENGSKSSISKMIKN